MAVTSPTPCAGWTALSPTFSLMGGPGGGGGIVDAGRRLGGRDGRIGGGGEDGATAAGAGGGWDGTRAGAAGGATDLAAADGLVEARFGSGRAGAGGGVDGVRAAVGGGAGILRRRPRSLVQGRGRIVGPVSLLGNGRQRSGRRK